MFVIRYIDPRGNPAGYVGSVEHVTLTTEHALKHATPADGEAWCESHPMPEDLADAGYRREVVAVGDAAVDRAADDPPAPDSEVIGALLNGSDRVGEG